MNEGKKMYNKTTISRCLSFLLLGLLFASQVTLAGTVTYYHTDASGSPVMASDAAGMIIWREHYQPYGEKLNEPLGEDIGYTGHEFDAETGLTYMQARYYDPEVGRFLAIDPVGFKPDQPMTFNRYSYANNNPYKYIDPDGKDTVVQLQYYIIGNAPLQGDYGHQYVYMRDTDTGETVISRGGPNAPYPGGVSGTASAVSGSAAQGPNGQTITLRADMTPAKESVDSVNGVPQGKPVLGSTVTLKESIGVAKATLGKLNAAVNAAKIPYKPRSTNSNAYANTAYQALTGKASPSSSTLPGSDVNLNSEIPACSGSDVCGGH